jgi:hypothetical protein
VPCGVNDDWDHCLGVNWDRCLFSFETPNKHFDARGAHALCAG